MTNICNAALELGFVDVKPITGHPFDVWFGRIKDTPSEGLAFIRDPAEVSGWPVEEITIWVAVSPTPPVSGWPKGCGEMGAHYVALAESRARIRAWEEAAAGMGYEIIREAFLPVRAAAIRAGLGVHGLNGLLITPRYGSFVDISVLLVRGAPPPDARGPEHDLSQGCIQCDACIKACPTGAISENGVNTAICLRHYMNRPAEMPEADYPKMQCRILGCDTCQLVCPENAALQHVPPPAELIECMKLEALLTRPSFGYITQHLWFNENFVKAQAVLAAANTKRKDLLPLVEALTSSEDEALNKTANWAANTLRRL